MRTIVVMLIGALATPAFAADPAPKAPETTDASKAPAATQADVEELRKEILSLADPKLAELQMQQAALKEMLSVSGGKTLPLEQRHQVFNWIWRQKVFVDMCGLQIEDQPMNGRHLERLVEKIDGCVATQGQALTSYTDAATRRAEGDTMSSALAQLVVGVASTTQKDGVITTTYAQPVATQSVTQAGKVVASSSTPMTPSTYVDVSKGVYASGPAATQAARGFGSGLDSFEGWVGAQAWANGILTGDGSVSGMGNGLPAVQVTNVVAAPPASSTPAPGSVTEVRPLTTTAIGDTLVGGK